MDIHTLTRTVPYERTGATRYFIDGKRTSRDAYETMRDAPHAIRD